MKLTYKKLIIIVAIAIPIGALFDAVFIERTNFFGYLMICFIEAIIFLTGVLCGKMIKETGK